MPRRDLDRDVERLRTLFFTERYPNAVMVHTPVHASWLNQIEIYFSIVTWTTYSPNSTLTNTTQPNPVQPDPRRTYERDH